MHEAHIVVQARCLKLKTGLSKLKDKIQKDDHDVMVKCFSNLEVQYLNLQLKYQHLKENLGNNNSLPAQDGPDFDLVFEIKKLKASVQGKDNAIRKLRMRISQLQETRGEADRTLDFKALDFQITQLTEKVSVLQEQNELFRVEMQKLNNITRNCMTLSRLCDNREVHLDYLKNLKESVATLREIVEEAKVERPLDRSVASACLYTKHSQELLEYVIGTCPKDFNKRDKKKATTHLNRKKQVTFADQYETSNTNTQKHVEQQITQKTNVLVVDSCTDASGSKPRSNTKKNRILPAKSVNKKTAKDHSRTNKSHLQKLNRVDSSISSKCTVINLNSDSICKTCNKCFILANHDICVIKYLHSVNATSSTKTVVRKVKQVWKPKQVVQIILWYLDSCCSKHMTGDRSRLKNFMKKFTETVRFRNDHCGVIMRKFYDSDLEFAFRKHSCYVHDTDDVELIKGSCGSNLYTISVEDMMKFSLICLLSKASKTKSWLWHHRLNHLNFGTINDLVRKDLVRGLPRLKFKKDHLCSTCQLGKNKKCTHLPQAENTNLKVLNTLHMGLCGPIRVQTVNGKKYILVIIDDYTRFTWVKFLRSKDETPEVVIKFHVQLDALSELMAFVQLSIGPAPTFSTPGQISSGLVPNLVPAAPYVPPTIKDMKILFQPMFDEYLEPPRVDRPVSPAPAVPVPANSAGTPSSTAID
nr:hypothetical protein [Tanacetum cinerariifolium]